MSFHCSRPRLPLRVLRGAAKSRGFTLLEILVAFSIMALSLGMLYRASGANARAADGMERSQRAILLAESLLSMNDAVPPEGWNQSGQSAGFSWRVASNPFPTAVNAPHVPVLHEVHLVIEWQDGANTRQIAMDTLRPERTLLPAGARP